MAKITPEELEKIQTLANSYNAILFDAAQLLVNRRELKTAAIKIEERIESILDDAQISLQVYDNYVDSITAKYGDGVLNIHTGEIEIPSK